MIKGWDRYGFLDASIPSGGKFVVKNVAIE